VTSRSGAGGIGPFLVGYDKGVKWKLLSALEDSDIWLMAKDPRLTDLRAFGSGDKIATPGAGLHPGRGDQAAAQEQLGDATKLDANLVKLAHPEALQSLLSGQVAAHMASPPFQFQEQDQGARKLLGSADVFGTHTFNSVFVREEYQKENAAVTDAVFAQIERATKLINDDPKAAAAILEAESGGQLKAADAERYLTDPSTKYTTEPHGFMAFATFMKEIGLIENAPASWKDLVFDNLASMQGS
jgi:NitT/TauT family transport system substrate-binding protein